MKDTGIEQQIHLLLSRRSNPQRERSLLNAFPESLHNTVRNTLEHMRRNGVIGMLEFTDYPSLRTRTYHEK